MDSLISICRWITKALGIFLSVATGLPGLIIACFTSSVLSVQAVDHDFAGFTYQIVQVLNTATTSVQAFMNQLSSFEYYPLFHDILALDVLGSLISSLLVIIFSLIGFILFGLFFQALVLLIPFAAFKLVTKIISVCSVGFLKP